MSSLKLRKKSTSFLKIIFLVFYYPLFIFTSLLFTIKVLKRSIPEIILLTKSPLFAENLKLYLLIFVLPFLLLSTIFIFMIVQKIISKKHIFILGAITLIAIVSHSIYFDRIYPKIEQKRIEKRIEIGQYCSKNAEELARKKAESKGYKPNTDTYFVIYVTTRDYLYKSCVDLMENAPTEYNFDWSSDTK